MRVCTPNPDVERSQAALSVEPISELPIVHAVCREGLSAVVTPQVLVPVERYRRAGWDTRLVVLCPVGEFLRAAPRQRWAEQLKVMNHATGGKVQRLMSPPSRWRWAWSDVSVFARWMRRQAWFESGATLHCRGAAMTHLALEATVDQPQIRVVFDCRGLEYVEQPYAMEKAGRNVCEADVQRLLDRERNIAHRADAVLCVSQEMARHVVEKFGVNREKIVVSPCTVDHERFAADASHHSSVRAELGLEGRFIVGYCGSLQAWQLPDASISLYLKVKQHEPSAHFLAVTTQPEKMREVLRQFGVPEQDATVRSVPHAQVARLMSAFDVGLLLREPSLVNQVASPVKFAEYLACGVPVILSRGIGDYSAMVESRSIGLVVEGRGDDVSPAALGAFVSDVSARREMYRQRCTQLAAEELSIDRHVERVTSLYRRLASESYT